MAEIVIGVACSHSPQLSTEIDIWPLHAERDRGKTDLIGLDGRPHSFDELLAGAPPALEEELTGEVLTVKFDRMRQALDVCRDALTAARADVAVVIGNDHKELFGDDGMPAFAVYLGDTVTDSPEDPARFAALSPDLQAAWWSYHGDEPEEYPVAVDLGTHLVQQLTEFDFDPTTLTCRPPGRNLGHAWTYPRRRLMGSDPLPMVPVHLNTIYPPNRPSPSRCYRFGAAIGEGIRSWQSADRVAVITTGGLSHFVVDEALDRTVIDALADDDEQALAGLPREKLRSGTSEILNWVVAAGALRSLRMELVDYVPAYRSPAGTGVGMTFALWR